MYTQTTDYLHFKNEPGITTNSNWCYAVMFVNNNKKCFEWQIQMFFYFLHVQILFFLDKVNIKLTIATLAKYVRVC